MGEASAALVSADCNVTILLPMMTIAGARMSTLVEAFGKIGDVTMTEMKLTADDIYLLRYIFDDYRRERVHSFHTAGSIQRRFTVIGIGIDPSVGLANLSTAGLLNDHQNGAYSISPRG